MRATAAGKSTYNSARHPKVRNSGLDRSSPKVSTATRLAPLPPPALQLPLAPIALHVLRLDLLARQQLPLKSIALHDLRLDLDVLRRGPLVLIALQNILLGLTRLRQLEMRRRRFTHAAC